MADILEYKGFTTIRGNCANQAKSAVSDRRKSLKQQVEDALLRNFSVWIDHFVLLRLNCWTGIMPKRRHAARVQSRRASSFPLGFWQGIGSVIDLSGVRVYGPAEIPSYSHGFEEDAQALNGDWYAVGKDLWRAIADCKPHSRLSDDSERLAVH